MQTIDLPSGKTITYGATEIPTLDQMTDVEIAQAIESLRLERQRVKGRRDEEAVQVRAVAHPEEKRLKAELARRKREGVPCPGCDDLGAHGIEPDSREQVYCEGCEHGLSLALAELKRGADTANEWLFRYGRVYLSLAKTIQDNLARYTAEHDRLAALLETLKRAR